MPIACGIDIGNRNITVAVVRKKGIDIVVNDVSNRQTPTFVSFTEKERGIGESGYSLYLRNIKNTITDIKRLICRNYNDPNVQEELKKYSFKTVALPNGQIGVEVMDKNEKKILSIEQIIAMLLNKIKEFTEEYTKETLNECVISVPGYFTEKQRRSLLSAAEISGIQCLRLMNEHTATGVAYGLYKTDLSETEARPVCIIDVGHSQTQCSVINFYKNKMNVISVEFNTEIGGRNYDEIVAEFIRKDILQKWKIDAKENAKMWNRIVMGVEKSIKRVISSGSPKAILNLDTLYEERDYHFECTRELFEELTNDLNNKIIQIISNCVIKSGLSFDAIHSFEITGSGTRLSSLQDSIVKVIGKPLSKTINCEESIARGCSIACAQMTPYFKVRDYEVVDILQSTVLCDFQTDKKNKNGAKIINKNEKFPNNKSLTITDMNTLKMNLYYSKEESQLSGTDECGVLLEIKNLPKTKTNCKDVKLKFGINSSGLIDVTNAIITESYDEEVEETKTIEEEVEEKVEIKENETKQNEIKENEKEEEKNKSEVKENEKEGKDETKMEEIKNESEVKEEEKKYKIVKKKVKKQIKEKVMKKKTVDHTVQMTVITTQMSKQEIQKLKDAETKMRQEDRVFIETAMAKNDLESYIYDMKDKLFGELLEFTNEEEAGRLSNELEKYIDWLYDEGEECEKVVYCDKKAEAEKLVKHIVDKKIEKDRKIAEEKRKKEEEERKKKEEEERKKKEEEEKKKKAEEEKKKAEEEKNKPKDEGKQEDASKTEPPPMPQ